MKTTIFPYAFGRIGGVSFELLLLFEASDLSCLSQVLNDQRTCLNQIKDKINEELYNQISRLKDPKSQNLLLNLKRDVYNNRDISLYMHSHLITSNTELHDMLQKRFHLQNSLKDVESTIDKLYNEAITNSVQLIKDISTQFFLRNGLIFSSDSIYQNLEKFTLNNQGFGGKKEIRMALSLLRYLTRSAAKTSPFSSYNSIFALKEKDNAFVPIRIGENSSKLSINNLIYLLLKEVLLSVAAIKKTFKIYLNPTLENTNETIKYFYNEDNNEGFHNVQISDVLSFIIKKFDNGVYINYADLLKEVEAVSGEAPERVIAYIDQLLEKGIIIFQLPVSVKHKDWPQQLLSALKSLVHDNQKQEIIECLTSLLNHLLLTIDLLENNFDTNERKNICDQAYLYLEQKIAFLRQKITFQKLDNIFKKLSSANLFYEDTLTGSVNKIDSLLLSESLNKIGHLHQLLQENSFKNEMRKEVAAQIKVMYNFSKIPLLTFYRDVYLANKIHEKIVFNYQKNLFRAFEGFFKALPRHLNEDKLDLNNYLADEIFNEFFTLDLFTQIGNIDGKHTLVVNNILSGAATNISRFISLYPAYGIDEDIKNRSSSIYKDMIVSELVDASIHNANTFPCLTDYVIDVSLKTSSHQNNIDLNDLFICLDEQQHVIIENKQGRRVIPIDFSMESIQRRSALMKFIDIFSDANSEGISGLLRMYENLILSNKLADQEPITVIPRLYYSDSIVLSRKKWLIKKEFLNQLLSNKLSESMQFVTFNGWKEKLKMPDHIFVKISKYNDSNNRHKPQYINLSSPLLFKLFKNLITKGDDTIEISEMFLAPEHLAKNKDEEPYVVEHIFNVSNAN